MLKVVKFLAKKKLGFRAMLDVIPLDASLVKGSHGRDNVSKGEQPIFASKSKLGLQGITTAEEVAERIMCAVRG